MPHRAGAFAATALAAALAACGGPAADRPGEGAATVYVSLPLRGASGEDGRDAADGARLALGEADGRAGEREVRAVYLDDTESSGGGAHWTPARAAANARRAIRDSTALAYIGDFESGATRASLPITNEGRILQISPASSATDLVVEPGSFDDVPDVQPSGERSFGRVVPSDEAQAEGAAGWAKRLDARRVRVVEDGSAFGESLAAEFEDAAARVGLELGRGRGAVSFLAGEDPALLREAPAIATDALLHDATSASRGTPVHLTSPALDPSQLPPAGQALAREFEDEYGRPPGRYAAYGYEAMAAALAAIERAGGDADRAEVIEAFFEIGERDSVLGAYSIDELGETTLDRMTGYRAGAGRLVPAARLAAR